MIVLGYPFAMPASEDQQAVGLMAVTELRQLFSDAKVGNAIRPSHRIFKACHVPGFQSNG